LGASNSREPASLPEKFSGEISTSATVDVAELDILYQNLPSYQPEPAGDSKVAEEMIVAEPITLPAESIGEMTVASLMPPVLATTGLRVITSPASPTLVIELALPEIVTSPTFIVAGVLVSLKTSPRSPMIPQLSPASASAISSTIMTVKPVKVLSFGTTHSPGVIEAEKEFVAEMVESFYKSLKRSIALILKGLTTSFLALKVVLSRNIESIRDFGGDDQAVALELVVEKFEKDVSEWCHLSSSDLNSSVDEEFE